MRLGKAKLMCVAGAAGLWLAGVSEGSPVAITYSVQNRSVSASSNATGFARGGTQSAPINDTDNHSQQASGFGDFSGSTAASSNVGPGNAEASGTASQDSTLGTTGFSASGAVRADSLVDQGGPVAGSASSVFHITFDVAQAESYTLTASLNSSSDFVLPGSDKVNIQLTGPGGTSVFTPITAINLSNFSTSGSLAAGTYSFAMDISTISSDEASNFVNYSVALQDGPENVDQGPVTQAVPLPSAAMNSMLMLGGLGIALIFRRRVQAWVKQAMI